MSESKQVYPWEQVGAYDPAGAWVTANEVEKEQADAITDRYAEDQRWTVEELAEHYETVAWRIRHARYVALCGGLLERNSRGGFKPAPARRKGAA